jgi:hypothetical protein
MYRQVGAVNSKVKQSPPAEAFDLRKEHAGEQQRGKRAPLVEFATPSRSLRSSVVKADVGGRKYPNKRIAVNMNQNMFLT